MTAEEAVSVKRAVVLNVDDHEPGRYARTRLLREAGYFVLEAGTGNEALAMVQDNDPAVVLLDVHLPDVNGLEVCRRIKQDPKFANTPVLQISASAVSDLQRVVGLDNGADAYLVEPVDSEVLLATVRALLRMRTAEDELKTSNAALKVSNAALERANAALRLSNEDLERFSYLASHDLQEPLRAMSIFATLLRRRYQGQLDDQADEHLKRIEEGAMRMKALIEGLLSYAQLGQNVEFMGESVDTNEAVATACENLQQVIREVAASVTTEDLPVVKGSKVQLIQLFQNLIGNALKYHVPLKAPKIEIRATARDRSTWLFSVADNGIGIEPQHHDLIFGAFKRLHIREAPGTGIGLANCRRIVERHGGAIWLESAGLGEGSTFLFTLPFNG